jgi:hypothetical protein
MKAKPWPIAPASVAAVLDTGRALLRLLHRAAARAAAGAPPLQGAAVSACVPLVLLLVGCAGPLATVTQRAELPLRAGVFRVHYGALDGPGHQQVLGALARVGPELSSWGALEAPVEVWLVPSHDGLEALVHRFGYDWLRAWARYDEVLLQAPRSWTISGATDGELDELLLHELTHCAMYQRVGSKADFAVKDRSIPLWFREGMASVTAHQGVRWGTLEDLSRALVRTDGLDPVLTPELLYRSESRPVYAAAHHAFAFLLRRYGHAQVEAVLDGMKRGALFPAAFERTIGLSEPRFLAEFRRYVAWRGFRRPGTPLRPPSASAK